MINSDKKSKPRPTSGVRLKSAWLFPQNQICFSTRILPHVSLGFCNTQARASAWLATQRLCYNPVRRADLGQWAREVEFRLISSANAALQLARFWAHAAKV